MIQQSYYSHPCYVILTLNLSIVDWMFIILLGAFINKVIKYTNGFPLLINENDRDDRR